jgi:chromosomal replication initiation ATPase DnaA
MKYYTISKEYKLQKIIESCVTLEHLNAVENIFKFMPNISKTIFEYYCKARNRICTNEKHTKNMSDEGFAKYVVKITCEEYGISTRQFHAFFSRRGGKLKWVRPRQVAAKIMKDKTNLSLSEIGYISKCRSHANVLYAIRTINGLLETKDPKLKDHYNNIIDKLR